MVSETGLRRIFQTRSVSALQEQCDKIAQLPVDSVQETASVLQGMIVSYYKDVRWQAMLAFSAAILLEFVAVVFFWKSASMVMDKNIGPASFSAISGILIQIMTGIVLHVYSRSARQFGGFHICLERTNRFLLANAMVEHLPENERCAARREVITTILKAPMLSAAILESAV
jgi:hypothetical protein